MPMIREGFTAPVVTFLQLEGHPVLKNRYEKNKKQSTEDMTF